MSVLHHRVPVTLADSQVWRTEGQRDHISEAMHPQTDLAEASVRVRMPHPDARVVTVSLRSLRAWISRHQAVVG